MNFFPILSDIVVVRRLYKKQQITDRQSERKRDAFHSRIYSFPPFLIW